MSTTTRALPGGTVVQIVATLDEDHEAREAVDVAHALLRAGARAIVVGGSGPLVSELQGLGGEWVHLDASSANPLRIRSAARALADLVSAERVDLIHARGPLPARSAALVRARAPTHLVTTFCDAFCSPLRADRRYMRALAAADRVVVRSRYLADFVAAQGKTPPARIHIIPPRVDTDLFDPAAVSRERANLVRRSWKAPPRERVLLVPGRLDPDKGQMALVEAARILVNGGLEQTSVIMAGSLREHPEYARALAARAQAHGVGDLIRAFGVCADMPAAYAAADFVVVPALAPPAFSRAAAEAQAMGRPVIASAVGALPEIVLAPPRVAADARTGWLAPGDESLALARTLSAALAASPPELRAISLRARARAEAAYAPSRIAASTLSVYTSLLEGPD